MSKSEQLHSDWLPMGLPNDPDKLREMLDWEDKFGPADEAVKKVIERKLERIENDTAITANN